MPNCLQITCFYWRAGKVKAQAVIDSLQAGGSTNLIAANHLALSSAMADATSRNTHVMILTDGEPDHAPRVFSEFLGTMGVLERARAAGEHYGVCVSTFGFGFDMNSVSNHKTLINSYADMLLQELLLRMSVAGHGMFSYIPDASMIGTVFCNFVANAM